MPIYKEMPDGTRRQVTNVEEFIAIAVANGIPRGRATELAYAELRRKHDRPARADRGADQTGEPPGRE